MDEQSIIEHLEANGKFLTELAYFMEHANPEERQSLARLLRKHRSSIGNALLERSALELWAPLLQCQAWADCRPPGLTESPVPVRPNRRAKVN